jgi:hypothetical protein
MQNLISEKRILWPREKSGRPRLKLFENDIKSRFKNISSVILSPNTRHGTKEVNEILGDGVFSFPKPVGLIVQLISQVTENDDYVLDSTAGSGTTAHAVIDLNNEDLNSRRFILIQQPYDSKENEKEKLNIARRITLERVRRVINGYTYKTPKGATVSVKGVSGSFSYVQLGPQLFGEYRDLGKKLPPYYELGKYIFYTETSRDFDKKGLNPKTGKIGEDRKTSYYLLYTPNNKDDQALSLEWLKSIEKSEKNKNLVVYCEKIWIHRDDLAKYQKDTGRKVRPMLIPFNLK